MVRVAVVGCAHGMLDDIYATVNFVNEMEPSKPVELLVCCGDFECMRNMRDLESLACPLKYRALHAFHHYYNKEKMAPVLTVFIGGNHEASGYLQELHYGGWVAPNIFYLGAAGVINVAGLRIAGLSGIYKQQHYTTGRFEALPYDHNTMRSVYHVRELEVYQLSHLRQVDKTPVGVFLSHDWPRGIEQHGNVRQLLRRKPFFEQEIRTNTLGSPAGEFLMYKLRPEYWFAAHLHVKFAAIVVHPDPSGGEKHSSHCETAKPAPKESSGEQDDVGTRPFFQPATTKFLALDKCLPRREFMQILDLAPPASESSAEQKTDTGNLESKEDTIKTTSSSPPKVMFDLEWLAILRATHHLSSANKFAPRVPQEELQIGDEDIAWVKQRLIHFSTEKKLDKPHGEWITDFVKTASSHGEEERYVTGNPQTDLLLELLKLPHVITMPFARDNSTAVTVEDPNEIDLSDEDDDTVELTSKPLVSEDIISHGATTHSNTSHPAPDLEQSSIK